VERELQAAVAASSMELHLRHHELIRQQILAITEFAMNERSQIVKRAHLVTVLGHKFNRSRDIKEFVNVVFTIRIALSLSGIGRFEWLLRVRSGPPRVRYASTDLRIPTRTNFSCSCEVASVRLGNVRRNFALDDCDTLRVA
jgi:hypothetical protein